MVDRSNEESARYREQVRNQLVKDKPAGQADQELIQEGGTLSSKVFKTQCIWIGGGMSIELQSNFSKGKSGNISSDELTDCARFVDAKISKAGRG
ncbi:hypothetical protein F511_32198 [Dorcoceras hygrometricum]|uniref:Uncharacterized protein n=1 Tax=Dorcoceras hygrometricum TaxID=472368 RepID=A0A2Z7D975_9LAMI|nr:hypothetical protein F511_32198 [Dorcoceras hygrometricum]